MPDGKWNPGSTMVRQEGSLGPRKSILIATYLFTVIALLLWLTGIFLAPYLRSRASPWQGLLYAFYSPVCHQVPERCYFLFGHPLGVCARCLGIYLGCLVGLSLYPWLRGFRRLELPGTRLFLLLSSPILIDTLGNFTMLWTTPNPGRLGTGLIWGTILPFYFITGMADLLHSLARTRSGEKKFCLNNFLE